MEEDSREAEGHLFVLVEGVRQDDVFLVLDLDHGGRPLRETPQVTHIGLGLELEVVSDLILEEAVLDDLDLGQANGVVVSDFIGAKLWSEYSELT